MMRSKSRMAMLFSAALFFSLSITAMERTPRDTSGLRENPVQKRELPATDIARIEQLPPVGKWMYEDDFEKAHWLGVPWAGKNLIEPINVILIDPVSRSAAEATARLIENLKRAGYTEHNHHSSGYFGFIADAFYAQIPQQKYYAFSNGKAEVPNDHGRLFGPCPYEGKYYFTGAFSREGINPLAHIKHCYQSFNRARDELSQNLDSLSDYKIIRFANLSNTIVDEKEFTTGDHDGIAVILELAAGGAPAVRQPSRR